MHDTELTSQSFCSLYHQLLLPTTQHIERCGCVNEHHWLSQLKLVLDGVDEDFNASSNEQMLHSDVDTFPLRALEYLWRTLQLDTFNLIHMDPHWMYMVFTPAITNKIKVCSQFSPLVH